MRYKDLENENKELKNAVSKSLFYMNLLHIFGGNNDTLDRIENDVLKIKNKYGISDFDINLLNNIEKGGR